MEITYELYLGHVNDEMRPPIVEAGGKAWHTRGAKEGRDPVIALVRDRWNGMPLIERIPSGALAEDHLGNQIVVP